jgi:hypothetical protein
VFDAIGRRPGVVDVDPGDTEPGVVLTTVDHRGAARRDAADERLRGVGQPVPEEDQPVGLLAPQHQRVALFPGLVVLGVAEQHRVAVPVGGVFDALEDQREERVADVGNRDEELARAQGAKMARRRIGRVAEILDRLQDLVPRDWRDDVRLAHDAGDGRRGDAGALGDGVDRGRHSRSVHPARSCRGDSVALLRTGHRAPPPGARAGVQVLNRLPSRWRTSYPECRRRTSSSCQKTEKTFRIVEVVSHRDPDMAVD